jgi:hypothetical protein
MKEPDILSAMTTVEEKRREREREIHSEKDTTKCNKERGHTRACDTQDTTVLDVLLLFEFLLLRHGSCRKREEKKGGEDGQEKERKKNEFNEFPRKKRKQR